MSWRKWNRGIRALPIVLLAGAIAAPAASQETTPAMLAAAAKEGKVVWYIVGRRQGRRSRSPRRSAPSIRTSSIEVERSGSERVFQRISQEYQSGIKNVDVVNSSDASHFLFWKQQKWLRQPHAAGRAALRRAVQGSGRILRGVARDAVGDGLQHQARAGTGGADRAISTCSIRNGRASS